MAYRRRRKSRGTWLPTIGTDRQNDEDVEYRMAVRRMSFDADWRGNVVQEVIDLTNDVPVEDQDIATRSLADVVGSEYFLKRIVGKVFIDIERDSDNQLVNQVLVGAGFFVARADENGAGPIDFATAGTELIRFDNYSPLAQRTMREPWIWRRTWMLQDVGPPSLGVVQKYPQANVGYGSVLDGPHIDAKTKRRIGNDDRLYFIVSATQWPNIVPGEGPYADYSIEITLDYRLFGSLRKAKTRGVF